MTIIRPQKPKEPEKVRYLGEDGKVYIIPVGMRVPCHPKLVEQRLPL